MAAAEGAASAQCVSASRDGGSDHGGNTEIAHTEEGSTMDKPLLHLVFGGEVRDPQGLEYASTAALDIVGIYPSYAEAYKAWRGASQRHVDHANIKYVIVHLHRLLDPSREAPPAGGEG